MADRVRPASVTLASYNVHMGVDGWGRPYDVLSACAGLGADLVVMQESWSPDSGAPSTAARVADHLGLDVVAEVGLAHGRLFAPPPNASAHWGPFLTQFRTALHLDDQPFRSRAGPADRPFEPGWWGLALLARLPVRELAIIELGRLHRDPARRAVIRGVVGLEGGDLAVYGTHMSHITHGSHAQYRRLASTLSPGRTAAVLAGDMNLWGPPVSSYFRGWHRTIVGRTWPAHRPHSQLDHVLATPQVTTVDARVGPDGGSDHRPVVVTVAVTPPACGSPGGADPDAP
jgi:endonuclease/exonuclease/phosphatase family metal-dependent hydrolase